jgi:hypothetical protein
MLAPWVSLRAAEIVREVADCLASNRDGFLVYKYALSVPNDQVTRYHPIQVIRASCHMYRPPLSRGMIEVIHRADRHQQAEGLKL